MNYNAIISVLVHKGILEYEEGEKLAHELVASMHDTNFAAAHKNVAYLLEKINEPELYADEKPAEPENTVAKPKKP